ncbi:MAG: glycoside hydrolase family 99-like domain-containing protein [Thermoguttaceae bacterium]|jgi:hypothetical protein|nr:glycoside hydrolase family 99-like domain-containing protein [Thermoguttaceae bacterium]
MRTISIVVVLTGLLGGAGTSSLVRDVARAAAPEREVEQPAEIAVREFGLDEAINRTGRACRLVCRVERTGGQPARHVAATLELPRGVELLAPQPEGTTDVIDQTMELVWRVRAGEPLSGRAKVVLRGNFAPVTATALLEFTPPPQVAPAVIDGKPYVPAPQPVKADRLVGVYYFPGWRSGTHSGWPVIRDFPERKPVLGWYEEGDPQVADWHIKWAVEHGISFFAYDWYWDRGARQLEHALHEGYFRAQYRKHLKFCLLWANHNPPGSASEEDLLRVTRYWIDQYFKRPEYLTIDGRPVVIIFTPHRITQDLGVERTKAAFAAMRAACREAGLAGLYLAGCTGPSRQTVAQMKEEGYDAATGYNYPSAGAKPEDGNRPPYDSAITGYKAIWDAIAGYRLMDYLPVTDPGWDARPWHGENTLARPGRHPAKFKRMLQLARQFSDDHPVGPRKEKIVLVEAWNEFGEGAAIEPHREFGFGYLDAIREVFSEAPAAHADVVPADVGLAVPQWKPSPPKNAWEFNTEGDAEGWGPQMGLEGFEVRGGVMRARVVSRDPAFRVNERLDAGRFRTLVVRMKLDRGTSAQLFWRPLHGQESEARSVRFATTPDNQFHEYRVDLGAVKTWGGRLAGLRLDPNSDPGSTVEVDYLRLE